MRNTHTYIICLGLDVWARPRNDAYQIIVDIRVLTIDGLQIAIILTLFMKTKCEIPIFSLQLRSERLSRFMDVLKSRFKT
jgi:hypothetical protein